MSFPADARSNKTLSTSAARIEKVSPADGIAVETTALVFLILTWITVLLRTWTRAFVVRILGWDDWTILMALVLFTVFVVAVLTCAAATVGEGFLKVNDLDRAIYGLVLGESFYVLTMLASKISFAIFFLRIMTKPWQRNTVYATAGVATVYNFGYFFFAVFHCGVPGSTKLLLARRLSNQCVSKQITLGVAYTHGVIQSVTDLIFAFLPFALLRGLHMVRREKVILFFILVLGTVGGIASMIRMKYIDRLATASPTIFVDINSVGIWSTIEPGLGIIAGSLATLRPLFRTCIDSASSYRSTRHVRSPSKSQNLSQGKSPPAFEPMELSDLYQRDVELQDTKIMH